MIDLHLHLDGSLSEEDFKILSKVSNIPLGDDFPNNIHVPSDCPSLESYLERFELPLKFLQEREFLNYVIKSLINRLYLQGLIYAEIRFAPQLHLQKGLTQEEVTEAVVNGLKEALKDKKGFNANIILCCMRQADENTNLETVEVANKFKGNKVVAIDLAGPEALYPATHYKNIFNKAKEYGLNIIIHAGEACGSDEIMRAIDMGAKRIGHGVHLSLDPLSINKVLFKDVAFEFCPTSNLQTKSLKTYQDVPLMDFLRFGIKVTVNTDNMTVSNTTIVDEYKHLYHTFHLRKDQIYHLLYTAIHASFISDEEKLELTKALMNKIDIFYAKIVS